MPTLFMLHLITLTSVKSTNSEVPLRTRDTIVSVVTVLKAGRSGIPFLAGNLMVTGVSSHGGKVAEA